MLLIDLMPVALRALPRDAVVLFFTRFFRLFAYGALSFVLVFYLVSLGLTESQVGLLLTLTLAGDIAISLLLTTRADQVGRRRTLIVGAILMVAAGIAFASTHNLLFLIIAGTIGVISPSGHEVGPFLSIEQAALSHVVPASGRTDVFAWYTLAGSVATALGALTGGASAGIVQKASLSGPTATGLSSFFTPPLASRMRFSSHVCRHARKSMRPPRQRVECLQETFSVSDAHARSF